MDGPSHRVTAGVPNSIVTEREMAGADGLRQGQRDRVVRTEHPAAALQRFLAQGAGRLRLPKLILGAGQSGRR